MFLQAQQLLILGVLPLQPLAGDWREKVKAAQAAAASPTAATAVAPAPTPAPDGRPDLAALTVGLPEGWKAMWDKQSKEVYYGNLTTKVRGVQSWCLPNSKNKKQASKCIAVDMCTQ